MSNDPKAPQNQRRAKVDALKRQQRSSERKKTALVVLGATAVAATLIAVPTVKILQDRAKNNIDIALIGSAIQLAGCDATKEDSSEGSGDHVESDVKYDTIPPSSGAHYGAPVTVNDRGFYSEDDTPRVEELVHNLEHGYTILWYDPDLPSSEKETLQTLAKRLRGDSKYRKFIAAAWDTDRGNFPDGKPLALAHWGKEDSFRQYCEKISGPATLEFMEEHPAADSPEPNAP
jgi:hypothetical protein